MNEEFKNWMESNTLSLNPSKTKSVIFGNYKVNHQHQVLLMFIYIVPNYNICLKALLYYKLKML